RWGGVDGRGRGGERVEHRRPGFGEDRLRGRGGKDGAGGLARGGGGGGRVGGLRGAARLGGRQIIVAGFALVLNAIAQSQQAGAAVDSHRVVAVLAVESELLNVSERTDRRTVEGHVGAGSAGRCYVE